MKKVALMTLGCKANWCDGEGLSAACRRVGLKVVLFAPGADAYVINTCTVTAVADQQSRQMIGRAKRMAPDALVIATGCMGELAREGAAGAGADAVFGTGDRDAALAFLFERLSVAAPDRGIPAPPFEPLQSRARAFLKIQDGCDSSCAYCIIPRARGRARSLAAHDVVARCLALAGHHREIVLTGISIAQWCDDEAGMGIITLIERLASTAGIPRLRLGSIAPGLVGPRLVALMGSGKMCRHVHLSIQSGSDEVLKRMRRGYGADEIARAVDSLAEVVPGMAITGDVIAGLPGEGEGDHLATLELLGDLPLAGLHVFPYSPRPETLAAGMGGQVASAVRRRRAEELRAMAAKKRGAFIASQRGSPLEAIVTSRETRDDGTVAAFSDNAISISLPAGVIPYGEMGRAIITEACGLNVRGIWDSHRRTRRSSRGSRRGSATSSSAASI